MTNKLLAAVLVAGGILVAVGTGSYLAVRQNHTDTTATAGVPSDQLAPPPSAGVTETEGTLTPPPALGTEESAASTASAPVAVPPPARAARAPERARPATKPAPRPAVSSSPTRQSTSSERDVTSAPPAPTRDETPATTHTERPSDPVASTTSAPEPVREAEAAAVPVAPPAPPAPQYEDLVLAKESVIGLQIENSVSSETARIEDRVDARVTRDVRSGGMVAIPAGSKMQGSVTMVERGGKVKERARLGVRFHTLVLADGTRVPLQTETVIREGDSPSGESAAKIGGAAVGGAIIGAILGGGKGAAIGGSIGAAGGTTAVMAGSRNPATLNAGSTVTVRLSSPATVTVEK
jgi:hypothetical protein